MSFQKFYWVIPFLIIAMGTIIIGMDSLPILAAVTQNTLLPNLMAKMPQEQAMQTIQSILKQQRIAVFLSPLILLAKWLCSAFALFGVCRLLKLYAPFNSLLLLISQCGIIIFFQELTIHLIIRMRRESIFTFDDLMPPIGLNMLFSNLDKPTFMILNYVSAFNICWIVFLTISLAALCRSSKLKAFAAVLPIWIFPVIFPLVLFWRM